jgi:hypothetical protein
VGGGGGVGGINCSSMKGFTDCLSHYQKKATFNSVLIYDDL